MAGERDTYSVLCTAFAACPVTGYDPTLQFLSVSDLARAVGLALQRRSSGIFNVVPRVPVTLRAALREAGTRAWPLPWTVQWSVRVLLRRCGVSSPGQMRYLRYHLTAAADKAARELGFVAQHTSLEAVRQACPARYARRGLTAVARPAPAFDAFGLDRAYIQARMRGFFGFLYRRYFRVETRGLERLPTAGGAVMVGMHRGFMPLDGVLTLFGVVQGTGRVPRFLIHPGVGLRFPFLFNLMSKLGGVIACHQNADRVLASGEILGVYPEGIRGAFTMYRHAHRIGPSWRNDCVVLALRHGVPIVPFVTVGSAEIFPILGRVHSRVWRRFTEWPFIPITPTFPLLPIPLPSKWHTLFLEPLDVGRQYPPEAADDPAVVRAIGTELKKRMEAAVAALVARRRSIFYGSLFEAAEP
jgi:1-acyl-sn-glycerol-3-phosphate acyltransferase